MLFIFILPFFKIYITLLFQIHYKMKTRVKTQLAILPLDVKFCFRTATMATQRGWVGKYWIQFNLKKNEK